MINAFVSVIAPVYNEAAVIARFLETTLEVLTTHVQQFELVLIDDGSNDQTVTICQTFIEQNNAIKLIALSRNYGHEIALTAGIDHCRGDYAVLIDADLQHPPELIPQLLAKALEGYDVVNARRLNRDNEGWLHRQTSMAFYRVAKRMTGFELDGQIGNFKVINRKVIQSLQQLRENSRHLLMLFAYVGFKTTDIPYQCQARAAGKTKYNLRKRINLAIDSIISFSYRPLRYMSFLAIFISLVLTVYAGYIVVERLFLRDHLAEGLASIIFITSGLFAVLFFFLAILSEYVSRILIESKSRPLYYIRRILSHDNQTTE